MIVNDAIIRPIKQSDNAELAIVLRSVLLELGMPRVGTAYADSSLDDMYSTYQGQKKAYFVVEYNRKIVGGAGIAPLENYNGNACELQKMYFLPEVRGKGIGYKMLELCLKTAKDFNFEYCYLETMPYMQNAVKLYNKYGFINLEKPMGDTGHYACQVWMTKKL